VEKNERLRIPCLDAGTSFVAGTVVSVHPGSIGVAGTVADAAAAAAGASSSLVLVPLADDRKSDPSIY